MKNELTLAAEWRHKYPVHEHGVVPIWNGAAYGWKDCLRDAGHERPSAIAVDAEGHVFEAQGGNDYD